MKWTTESGFGPYTYMGSLNVEFDKGFGKFFR